MKTFLLTVAACGLLLTGTAKEPLYRDSSAPLAERVDDLLSRMTLREKLGQLSQPLYRSDDTTLDARITRGEVGSLVVAHGSALAPAERDRLQRIAVERSRLGIPVLFGFDVIHGYRTLFPIPLGIAASWNPELAEASARIAASEASACGIDLTFSPMVDVARDPRWGRISEGSGEDVLLNAVFGAALVRGYQGDDPSKQGRIGACVKHFVGYGAALGGRDYQFTELSERALRETYLPPFKACVDAGAVSVMSAFNDISGTPASANALTLDRILRKEWGFDGFVLSDWNAVTELQEHGIAADGAEAAVKALTAGVDMEMTSDLYLTTLEQSVREKRLPAALVDRAVRAVLRVKFRLGLFDRPFRSHPEPDRMLLTPEARRTARQLAAESMVLLKNDGVLPLSPDLRSITVTGEWAVSRDLYGWWVGMGDGRDARNRLGRHPQSGRREDRRASDVAVPQPQERCRGGMCRRKRLSVRREQQPERHPAALRAGAVDPRAERTGQQSRRRGLQRTASRPERCRALCRRAADRMASGNRSGQCRCRPALR